MTFDNYRRYFAEFMEEIRSAFPDKEIVHDASKKNLIFQNKHSRLAGRSCKC